VKNIIIYIYLYIKFIKYRKGKNYFYNSNIKNLIPNWNNKNAEIWLNYSLSSNQRGDLVADTIEKYGFQIHNKYFLDVGSAYGGFPIAFAKRGAKSYGLEISKNLIQISLDNFKDNKIYPKIFELDITDKQVQKKINQKFDIITCNDVIEHVKNPKLAIKNMSSLLNPGGILYMEIPNKNYPPFVLEDGHYQMFGLSQLNRSQAETYFKIYYPDMNYGVEYYLELNEYKEIFNKNNLNIKVIDESYKYFNIKYLEKVKNEIQQRLKEFTLPQNTKIESLVKSKVRTYLRNYDLNIKSNNFKQTYGTDFWKIICKKI